jgi:hypothetical protein
MELSKEEKQRRKEDRYKIKYDIEHKIIDNILYKWCNIDSHWVIMDDEHFYKNPKNPTDGFSTRCKICEIKRAKKRMYDNYDDHLKLLRRNNARPEVKIAMREASKKQRLRGDQKQWQQDNRDKVNQYAKNHRIHDISTQEWNDCLKIFNHSCAYCGISNDEQLLINKQQLHKEHVDDDGYNDLRNAVPACRSCNDKKWLFNMEEWFREQPFFSEERLEKIYWWITEGYKQHIENKPPYRYSRSRIYNKNGTWKYQHELWSVDDKRNMIECIKIACSKKELFQNI